MDNNSYWQQINLDEQLQEESLNDDELAYKQWIIQGEIYENDKERLY